MIAAGAGWAWIEESRTRRLLHVTGARGPRGPLTIVTARVPVLAPGDRVQLDLARARPWRTPPPPAPGPPAQVLEACAAVRPHRWPDPRALALGREPVEAVAHDLAGHGPGLTPAGDDALLGYVLARRALDPAAARREAATVLALARHATGGPALALLRWAARGQAAEPAAAMLARLLAAEGPALAPAVRRLAALGRTTGRAILTGMTCALEAWAAASLAATATSGTRPGPPSAGS